MQTVTTARSQDPCASLACPRCNQNHHLDLQTSRDNRLTTVLCSCGETFLAVLDARRFERKTVAIRGMYTVMSDSGLGGMVRLRDFSEGGVGFTLSRPCELEPGWLITVVFELAGREKRVIIAKATIRSVKGMELGCSFVNPEQVRQDILAYFDS
ncbi:MAG: PilZ domain-containing protein [bacterium]|nr:PilZ domain-containing protein [bacterium]